MSCRLILISNPFEPQVTECPLPAGKSLRSIIGDAPVEHLYLNGKLTTNIDYTLKDGDEVAVFVEPGEGLTTILIIASFAFAAASAIYVLTSLPDEPEALNASPTYSLRAQSNISRLGEAIPVQYGELRVYPDLITQPWVEYVSNEQYLHQVFSIGKGEFDVSDIRISDTSISNFDDVSTEILYEGPVTLFPSNVENSVEVANQQLSTTNTGPFIVNQANTDINRISVDFVYAEGLYRVRSSGRPRGWNAGERGNIIVEYQEVDDAGSPVGGWLSGVNVQIVGKSLSPLRVTYSFTVPNARYQVRVRRTINADPDQERSHDRLLWEGMRGFIVSDDTYENTTLLAVRMKATEQLSSLSRSRFNVFARRKISIYNGSIWTVPQVTRNPAWAFADVLRDSDYGAGRANSEIDIPSLEAFATACTNSNFNFDGRFDVITNVWKTLEQIAAVAKGFPVVAFDVIGVKQETTQTLPSWVFNRANMENENFISVFERSEDYDSVEGRYLDQNNEYKEDSVIAEVSGTELNPRDIDFRRGITNRDHCYVICKYIASKEKYSNLQLEFDTEIEGYLPEKGDLISVATDALGDLAIAGEVLEYDATPGSEYIILSQEVSTDQAVQHAVVLRERDGDVSGPHNGTINASNPARIDLDAALPFDPSPVAGEYNVIAAWGERDFSFRNFIVTAITPKSEWEITVEAVIYDSRIYDETGTVPPPAVRPALPRISETPNVFNIRFENTAIPDIVAISWQADQGWEYFVVQTSDDGGTTWDESIQLLVPRIELPVRLNDPWTLTIRVRAVGVNAGPWLQASLADVSGSDFTIPDDAVTGLVDPLSGADYDLESTLTYTWTQDTDIPQYYYTLSSADGEIYLEGFTTDNSIIVSQAQIVGAAARGRVANVIARFDVYPAGLTNVPNLILGQGFDIRNAQMPAPTNVVLNEGIASSFIVTTTVTSPPNDFQGMQIFLGESPGFTPSETSNMVYDGDYAPNISLSTDAQAGEIRYVRVGLYDQFGKDNITLFVERSITITSDVENDSVLGTQFGASVIPNSYLDQVRIRQSGGTAVPGGWYLKGNSVNDLQYSDSGRDKIDLMTSSGTADMISVAFSVNPSTTYKIFLRLRANSGTPTITFGVTATNSSSLPTDDVAISATSIDTFTDPEIANNIGTEDVTTFATTTSFVLATYDYDPADTDELASVLIRADAGESYEIDYCYVRDNSTIGAQTGLNLLDEDGNPLNDEDIGNDALIGQMLGGSAWPNPGYGLANPALNGRPDRWFLGSDGGGVNYTDDTRDTILFISVTGAATLVSEAFPVEPNRMIKIFVQGRTTQNTANINLRVTWSANPPSQGFDSFTSSGFSLTSDSELETLTGTGVALDTFLLTTSWSVSETQWVVPLGARWATFQIVKPQDPDAAEIDWSFGAWHHALLGRQLQSTNYVVGPNDVDTTVEMTNSSTATVTLPNDSDIPTGAVIRVFRNGTGTVNVATASGVTMRYSDGTTGVAKSISANNVYSWIKCIKASDTVWDVEQDQAGSTGSFAGLSDTVITSPAAGALPVFSSGAWRDQTVGGDGSLSSNGTLTINDDSHNHTELDNSSGQLVLEAESFGINVRDGSGGNPRIQLVASTGAILGWIDISSGGVRIVDGVTTAALFSDGAVIINNSGTEKIRTTTTGIRVTSGVGGSNAIVLTNKPSITGSRGGNAALASLLAELEDIGLITDNTTA